jgi:membrane-associated phospholipid phosphatase
MHTLRRLDDRILFDVNGFARHTGWLHGAVWVYATYGVLLVAALLLAGVWRSRAASDRGLAAAVWAGLATLIAVAANQPLVSAFAETRPYTTHHDLLVLATRSTDFSFPSDHAVTAGAAAAGLWLASRALGVLATVAALVMAFARVYIAAHYPWDVLAGLVVGAWVALVGWAVLRPLLTIVTGWLRRQAGMRQVFPVPVA